MAIFDIAEEIRRLTCAGITADMIREELEIRSIPDNEMRYFGVCSTKQIREYNPLEQYDDCQLKQLETEMIFKLHSNEIQAEEMCL